MSEQAKPKIYTISEVSAISMLQNADDYMEITANLIEDKISEDPLDMRVVSYLCDSFSCNYHIRKILKTGLNFSLIDDETEGKIVVLDDHSLVILENATLSFAFTKRELLRLNYSLALH
tara:strand:+ start:3144 stop:3500 length:357 start_codon:yes stop_codon:yes gene_type:complete